MPIEFTPNLSGLIRNLVAQGVTPEAAAKAIEKYIIEHGDEILEAVRQELQRLFHWQNKLASHGYSIGAALQPGAPPAEAVTVDPPAPKYDLSKLKTFDDIVEALCSGVEFKYYSYAPDEFDFDHKFEVNGDIIDEGDDLFNFLCDVFDEAEKNESPFGKNPWGQNWERLILRMHTPCG